MIELKIMINDDGQVGVQGPLDDTFKCYAMLEVARDVIHDRAVERKRSAIVPAPALDLKNFKVHQ